MGDDLKCGITMDGTDTYRPSPLRNLRCYSKVSMCSGNSFRSCVLKNTYFLKIYPWINLYLNIKIAWKKGLTLISLRCKAEVNPLNCLWREWIPRWCILWRSLSSAIDKRQFLSSNQTIVRVYLIETSQLFDEHGCTGELEETFLQSPWRKLLSYSSVSEEIGTGVFLKYTIRKIIQMLKIVTFIEEANYDD